MAVKRKTVNIWVGFKLLYTRSHSLITNHQDNDPETSGQDKIQTALLIHQWEIGLEKQLLVLGRSV